MYVNRIRVSIIYYKLSTRKTAIMQQWNKYWNGRSPTKFLWNQIRRQAHLRAIADEACFDPKQRVRQFTSSPSKNNTRF